MFGVPGMFRVVATLVAIALPLAVFAAAPAAPKVNQHVADCGRYSGSRLLDCQCVEKETARLSIAEKSAPSDVVFDRAAAACPSTSVKSAQDDPRYRHHTFEERRAIRKLALDYIAELSASSETDTVVRILSTPRFAAMLTTMPTMRAPFEQRVRDVLARRAARGKLTNHRVAVIGTDYVTLDARSDTRVPGVEGDGAYAALEIVKFSWSANGAPELADYDFGY